MNGRTPFHLTVCWIVLMVNIFKNIKISEEIAYIGTPPIESIPIEIAVPPPFVGAFPDGLAQERAHLQEQTKTLTTLLQSIPQAISDERLQLSSDIADIVLLIVSKFFINQQQNKNALAQQITQILTQLNEQQHLEIALHPQDLALMQQGEINIDLRACKNLRFKADAQLRLGGCIITSEHGVFDAGIERQIDNLKHVLLQMRDGV